MVDTPNAPKYPWYTALLSGDTLEQGDILEACPVVMPKDEPSHDSGKVPSQIDVLYDQMDVIVMSQSCDLVKGNEKLDYVLLCGLWQPHHLKDHDLFSKPANWENARKGRIHNVHLLAPCELEDHARDRRLVDFTRIYSLPLNYVRAIAAAAPRIRLLPPYREHLSQAFARYFMRIGLPIDIPSPR